MHTRILCTAGLACLFALTAAAAMAQADYPTRPVRLIHGFTPGGISDVLARTLGAKLTANLGQPVVVETRPGAGTTIASDYIAKSPGDGYTLFLQDITTHLDFSALAHAGREGGLNVIGYATQARFLVNCGITDILSETPATDAAAYAPLAAQANTLLSPAEMGELFKVIAFGKGVAAPLRGFTQGDRSHTL